MTRTLAPSKISLNREKAELTLCFDETGYALSSELLRVLSPSAEVQGHGPGQKNVPLNKTEVKINQIEAQGNYAIRLIFDDGHNSGIYTWAYLFDLCVNKERHWSRYLKEAEDKALQQKGVSAVKWTTPSSNG